MWDCAAHGMSCSNLCEKGLRVRAPWPGVGVWAKTVVASDTWRDLE